MVLCLCPGLSEMDWWGCLGGFLRTAACSGMGCVAWVAGSGILGAACWVVPLGVQVVGPAWVLGSVVAGVLSWPLSVSVQLLIVLGKFGLVWFEPLFAKPETGQFSFWQNF